MWRKPAFQLLDEGAPKPERIQVLDGEPRTMNLRVNLDVKAAARMSVHDWISPSIAIVVAPRFSAERKRLTRRRLHSDRVCPSPSHIARQ